MNEQPILIKNIKPNDYNPNEMTEEKFNELVQEVKHLGKPPKPIILRRKGDFFEIVDGEHCYKALKELGFKELQAGWFEIVDYDDLEAKRQTYKRNLGGKNNPVKLGLMFSQALEKSGLSNRQLAEQWGISEGTIRNYLLYATASKMRNDYANLANLNVDQIRLYVKIAEGAKPIADFWLACGALEDALVWFGDEKFKEAIEKDPNFLSVIKASFKDIIDTGFHKVLSYKEDFIPSGLAGKEHERQIQKFKDGIKKASRIANLKKKMISNFNWDNSSSQERVNEYIDLYFNNPLSLKSPESLVENLFATVIKKVDNKLEFMLTPEELRKCMELEEGEGYRTIIGKARLMIANKHQIAPSEIEGNWGGIEAQLNKLEIEKRAPQYLKEARMPIKLKIAFLDVKIEDNELRKTRWEAVNLNYKRNGFKNIDLNNEWKVKEKIKQIINQAEKNEQDQKEKEALKQRSEQELAEIFMEKIRNSFTASKESEKELVERMAKIFPRQYLYLLVWLANKYFDEMEFKKSVFAELTALGKK